MVDDVMQGKYGAEAKVARESHEGAICLVLGTSYQCKGHYIGSEQTLSIVDRDLSRYKAFFVEPKTCPVCMKEMKPLRRQRVAVCPKCRGRMEPGDEQIMYD